MNRGTGIFHALALFLFISPCALGFHILPLSGDELQCVPGDLVHHGQLLALRVSDNPSSSLFIPLMSRLYFRVRPSSKIIRNKIMAECLHPVLCNLEQLLVPVRREQEWQGDVFLKTRCLLMLHCL